MNWYTLKKEFKAKFPNWLVKVDPPCVSETRYTHYYYEALTYALGKKSTVQGYVEIDEINKEIIIYR